ncbi:MAG TPA: hypothetical protein DEA16_03045 [Opitutae bacterium]|jgi:HPt (histidine-containing phosphotransfer) domain-containing protein|nr:hypothetical protein [Opitutae bacterium]HBR67115.1 hypothetical protein [Opitutae bacterium]
MSQQFYISGVNYDQSIPVMDREQIDMLLMIDAGDDDSATLVQELFELFKSESSDKFKKLDVVCAANDIQALRKIVHFVAGSAGNIGLARLSGFYREIEKAIDLGKLTDLSQCAAPIQTAFREACEAFAVEFSV